MISLLDDDDDRFAKFHDFFDEEATSSEMYKNWYIFKPISIEAKFKQNCTETLNISSQEPLYNISLIIDSFEISFTKTQFEAILKFIQNANEFQMFQDNFSNKKKANIECYYSDEETFNQRRIVFEKSLLKKVTRDVKILALEGTKIS